MSVMRKLKSLLWNTAFAALLSGFASASMSTGINAAELPSPDGIYPYSVVEQDLKIVISEYGQNIGVRVQISPKVEGTVRGKLQPMTAGAFLEHLSRVYNLDWYFDGHVLYVSAASEGVTRVLKLGRLRYTDLVKGLKQAAYFDTRYAITPSADGKSVTLAAPPRYVALIQQNIEVSNVSEAAPLAVLGNDQPVKTTIFRGNDASVVEFTASGIPIR